MIGKLRVCWAEARWTTVNTFSGALVWFPTGSFEEGFSGQGWGDLENHQEFSTRVGLHFNRSDENKESQPGSDTFENTQIRLSDGTVIFTSDLFGPGVTITDVRWRMTALDAALKYRGFALEGVLRWVDNFRGENTAGIPRFLIKASKPRASFRRHSCRAFADIGFTSVDFGGQPGSPSRTMSGEHEALYLYKSPVGYSSVPFVLGGKGWVFHSTVEMAF
jgi:hypothetical protein